MRTHAKKGWLRLKHCRYTNHVCTLPFVRPSLAEISEHSTRPFKAHECLDDKSRGADFVLQLIGAMEVRGGKSLWVSSVVLIDTVAIDALNDVRERRVHVEIALQAVQCIGPARYRRSKQHAARFQYATCFADGATPIHCIGEMIQGTKQQHHIN